MPDTQSNTAEPLVEPLTRREREILGLMDAGLSAPEIAQRLTLAVSSVKWHIGQVYGKLGVKRRQQALLRARALGLLAAAAALPAAAPRHNLPMALTRFFGREPEMAQIKGMLAEYRLVTLTGAGGVGKTRLALRVAEEALNDFADGTRWVDLAPLSYPALVAQAIAVSLGVHDVPDRPLVETLIRFLRGRQMLLVLDNCEHLLAACAPLAEQLLSACPRLTLLTTSREPLGVAGEAVFPTPSLAFPDPDRALTPEQINRFPAVDLFVDRARMVHPNYQITPHNAAWLARVCARLDGVPLALEMAAARMNLLTAEQLAHRLDDAFGALAGGHRTALPRQQTLRATLDWSYAQLNEEERLLLQRLSVFAGGCTLEAAEAVCVGEGLEANRVLDTLASLVAKSMVVADRRQGEETRYRLLEMVRQYGAEKLAANQMGQLRQRHLDYYLVFAEMISEKFLETERTIWEGKLQACQDDLRRALTWSFSRFNEPVAVDAGPRLLSALSGRIAWTPKEWLDWSSQAAVWCQEHEQISLLVQARLLGAISQLIARDDLPKGIAGSKEAVAKSRQLGPECRNVLMENLIALSVTAASNDDIDTASAACAEAEAIFQLIAPVSFAPAKRRYTMARFADIRARLANKQGRHLDAKQYANASMDFDAGNGEPASFEALIQLGEATLELGDFDLAREYFVRLLPSEQDHFGGSTPANSSVAYINRCLGLLELKQGNLEQAITYCRLSLIEANDALDRPFVASGLALAATIWAKLGNRVRSACLSGAAQTMYARTGRPAWEDSTLYTILPGWPAHPDHATLAGAYAAGQALDADEAVAYALDEAAV